MASYYRGGTRDEDADDFDEYDPTPYGGGFDLVLTYGRPIPPSDETCHPSSSSSSDYQETPSYTSSTFSKPSAYDNDADDHQYSRPKPSGFGARPEPNYGFGPGVSEPTYGGGDASDYGGRPPKRDDDDSSYGFQPKPSYGHGRPDFEKPSYEQAEEEPPRRPAYGRPSSQQEQMVEDYEPPKPTYGRPGFGQEEEHERRKPSYGQQEEFDHRRPAYEKPSYEQQEEYEHRRPEYEKPSYEQQEEYEHRRPAYQKPSYERQEEYEPQRPTYGRPTYGRKEDEEEEPRRLQTNEGEKGYSRPNYGDDSDDEKKKHRHQKHHHRKYADDE
eukprot:TRINITY_DN100_c0_g1_i2.p1 TRINITY_DN100_c0_g1~~TRINITY_DN100_c0_g1_i2.p1  ORF type:complete len:328 (-),score=64.20 TRINITY_DN100_c0_g1_i2:437-1420(-)